MILARDELVRDCSEQLRSRDATMATMREERNRASRARRDHRGGGRRARADVALRDGCSPTSSRPCRDVAERDAIIADMHAASARGRFP